MSEDVLIPIVDRNDNVIEYKPRKSLGLHEINRITTLWITNGQGEILIARRSLKKKSDPGLWGVAVAGTVEQGETYEENVVKEAHEEIGLAGVPFVFCKKYFYDGPCPFVSAIFTCVVNWPIEKFTLQVEEVDKVKWLKMGSLIEDVKNHPERFVPSFPDFIKNFE